MSYFCWSQWLRGLRRRSTAAHLLRSWVWIPPGAWMFVVSVVCCHVEVSLTSWSVVQRSPTDCGVSLCVIKKPQKSLWMRRRPRPTRGLSCQEEKKILFLYLWTANCKTKGSALNDNRLSLNSFCSKVLPEGNFDMLGLFPNISTVPPLQAVVYLSFILWFFPACLSWDNLIFSFLRIYFYISLNTGDY